MHTWWHWVSMEHAQAWNASKAGLLRSGATISSVFFTFLSHGVGPVNRPSMSKIVNPFTVKWQRHSKWPLPYLSTGQSDAEWSPWEHQQTSEILWSETESSSIISKLHATLDSRPDKCGIWHSLHDCRWIESTNVLYFTNAVYFTIAFVNTILSLKRYRH